MCVTVGRKVSNGCVEFLPLSKPSFTRSCSLAVSVVSYMYMYSVKAFCLWQLRVLKICVSSCVLLYTYIGEGSL